MTGPDAFSAEREELQRILGRMAQATRELDESTQTQLADLRRQREVWAEQDAERAKLARRGDLGPNWQRLQRRLDLNETSMSDIVSGDDASPEAVAIRQAAREKAAELYAQQVAERDADEPSELASEIAGVRAEVQRLRAALGEVVELGNRPYGSISVAEVRASAPSDE